MPELPEVETMRRGISGIVGSTIRDIERPPCRKKPIHIKPRFDVLKRKLQGQRIAAVDRLGKRVVVVLADGGRLVIEPRMTGLVLVADPPTDEHLRLRLKLRGGNTPELLFWDRRGLGTVTWYTAKQYEQELCTRLGPDALSVDAEGLREQFAASRSAVKVALLDQSRLAGVGNLYASEILHLAGISPRARCCRLSRSRWRAIHAALREVLEAAIRHEGSTLSDGTYRNALNQDGGYQNQHSVYDKQGEVCRQCGRGTIRRIVQAQRSTFYCPRCQSR